MIHRPDRRRWLRHLALSSAALLTESPAAWAASSAQPLLHVPPMACLRRTLANGLEVLALPGGGSGSVSVQVWYRVGGKDDPEGRSGFAHLFEHLMFKGTRHMAPEQIDRLTEDVGGQNNAFTSEDNTTYQNLVPSHHLERILWAEAERMASLNVDEANFLSERAVVQEEYRQRVLADPYGRLFNAMVSHTFDVHPYRRPVIGSITDLDAATLEDVRAFHATYYRPDNAFLIVVGDFDPMQLDGWVNRYFGPIQRPTSPIPRVNVREPAWTHSPAPVHLHGPNVPLPATVLLWKGPPASHPDGLALQVAQVLLSSGEASRLHEGLVQRRRIAQSAGWSCSFYTDASSITAYAIAAGAHRPEALVAPLLDDIRRLAHGPIPAAELDKARTQVLTSALVGRQTPEGRADALGWAMIHGGDPAQADRELMALQTVRAEDVRQALRRHVIDRPMATLYYSQAPQAEERPS